MNENLLSHSVRRRDAENNARLAALRQVVTVRPRDFAAYIVTKNVKAAELTRFPSLPYQAGDASAFVSFAAFTSFVIQIGRAHV